MHESINNINHLTKTANRIRQNVVKMLSLAGSGHSAGSLGMADIFTALYFHILQHDPKRPHWRQRDRVILSAGHICPVWYATLAEAGYFPKRDLWRLRQIDSPLQGHPVRGSLPGVENTSGPLGQGISVAVGMAYAIAYLQKSDEFVYCLTSDGEHNEGQTWEAIMFAAKYKLPNLIVIVDRNYIQIDGRTEDVMPLDSLKAKYKAFNWQVLEIDGHNMEEIITACQKAKMSSRHPTCIIARTIAGKGVSFMENDFRWHGKAPSPAEAEQALKELKKITKIQETRCKSTQKQN